jgi:hypothetical protein
MDKFLVLADLVVMPSADIFFQLLNCKHLTYKSLPTANVIRGGLDCFCGRPEVQEYCVCMG